MTSIASDVHGKNHHKEGGFGQYVVNLTVATGSGEVIRTSSKKTRICSVRPWVAWV